MRIGIYANINYGHPGGIQQYIEKIFVELIKTEHTFIIITNQKFYDNFFKEYVKVENVEFYIASVKEENFKKYFYNFKVFKISDILFQKLQLDFFVKKHNFKKNIEKLELDCLHFPYQVQPMGDWKIPTLITLHDLQQEYFPEFFSKKELVIRNKYYPSSAKKCSHILVSFEHVKNDVIKFYNIAETKITVTGLGLDNVLTNIKESFLHSLENKDEFLKGYVFYPAQTWKHKNHIRLLESIAKLRDESNLTVCLICSGKKNEHFQEIERKIQELNLENQVLFLGFISTSELVWLYRHAIGVVIPTLYEAGSFPLYEAISLKVPVICSNVTSLPETIGDDKYVFDPKSIESIRERLLKLVSDGNYREKSILNSSKRIKEISWDSVINQFIIGYQKACNYDKNII